MFTTVKLLGFWIFFGAIAGILGIPWTLVTRNIGSMYRAGNWIARAGLRFAGIRVVVSGRENIPAGRSCLFLSNHVSNLDPPVLFPLLPGRSSVLLKRELMSIPILGTAMKMAGFVPVERAARRDSAQASVNAAAGALAAGLNILIFPEGTRSGDGRLGPFKKGPFYLALQSGAPIVPVAISGTERMMGKGSNIVSAGVAQVKFLPPLDPAAFTTREDLRAAVHAAIAAALPESMRPQPHAVAA